MTKISHLKEDEFEEWITFEVDAFNNNVFDNKLYHHFKNHYLHDPSATYDDIYIIKEEEQIVSAARIFKRVMNINNTSVDFIGIGEVATSSSHRGQGLSSKIITQIITDYKESKYKFLYLATAISSFYAQFGFLDTYMNYKTITFPPQNFDGYYIKEKVNFAELKKIYEAYSSKINGTLIRDDKYFQNWTCREFKNLTALYFYGKLVAYFDYEIKNVDEFVIREFAEIEDYSFEKLISLLLLPCLKFQLPHFILTTSDSEKIETIHGRLGLLLNKFTLEDLEINTTEDLLMLLKDRYVFWRTDNY